MKYYLATISETAENLKSSPQGLDDETVRQRQIEFGPNEIEAKKKKTVWGVLLSQFADFMILILVGAAIVFGILGDVTDTIVILAIVLINAFVGFLQEWRAEKAIAALQEMSATHARVVRNNQPVDVLSKELVPGDVVHLEAGNVVPADIRFFETYTLKIDESSLTGESLNIQKFTDELKTGDYSLGDRVNVGYKGTFVTHGHGLGYVTVTGMKTELGLIAEMIQTEDSKTPLQKKLGRFGKQLTFIILILCTIFFFVGWARGESWSTMLLTSISLAVAAIPEALPALVTIALAMGAKRLVKNKALIRKLPAVETLGSVTFICTDKTGTLTLNKMTVEEIYEPDQKSASKFFDGKDLLLQAMALNNDVTRNNNDEWIGDSTELALVQYAEQKNYARKSLEEKYRRVAELPFDSARKCMTTLHQTDQGILAIVKGAVDVLAAKLIEEQKTLIQEIQAQEDKMAAKGYRMLGYGMKLLPSLPDPLNPAEIESSLTFIGFASMIDPPREEVKKAVAECKSAGIVPVMITGDHQLTAKSIAETLGIIATSDDRILGGHELEKLNEDEFASMVETVKVYARVSPKQKLRIIHALQAKGNFVAMTGDGVNDAPALKNSDIGIAMGINGTQVSKEAAHMILLDDNFATIVVAVKHGRRIYDNILKFIKYIMTGNSGEIWAIFLAPLVGLPIPLLAIQILWINLISDGLPGLALASEPAEATIMQRPPRNPKENIFAGSFGWHILIMGLVIGLLTLGIQAWAINRENTHWQTMTFTVLCFSQLFHVMAIRSSDRSTFSIGLFSNKAMIWALSITCILQLLIIYTPLFNRVFRTEPLSWQELIITVVVSSIVFWVLEVTKLLSRRRSMHATPLLS